MGESRSRPHLLVRKLISPRSFCSGGSRTSDSEQGVRHDIIIGASVIATKSYRLKSVNTKSIPPAMSVR